MALAANLLAEFVPLFGTDVGWLRMLRRVPQQPRIFLAHRSIDDLSRASYELDVAAFLAASTAAASRRRLTSRMLGLSRPTSTSIIRTSAAASLVWLEVRSIASLRLASASCSVSPCWRGEFQHWRHTSSFTQTVAAMGAS